MNVRILFAFLCFRMWAWLLYSVLEQQVALQNWQRGRSYSARHAGTRRRDGSGRHRHVQPTVVGLFSPNFEKRLAA